MSVWDNMASQMLDWGNPERLQAAVDQRKQFAQQQQMRQQQMAQQQQQQQIELQRQQAAEERQYKLDQNKQLLDGLKMLSSAESPEIAGFYAGAMKNLFGDIPLNSYVEGKEIFSKKGLQEKAGGEASAIVRSGGRVYSEQPMQEFPTEGPPTPEGVMPPPAIIPDPNASRIDFGSGVGFWATPPQRGYGRGQDASVYGTSQVDDQGRVFLIGKDGKLVYPTDEQGNPVHRQVITQTDIPTPGSAPQLGQTSRVPAILRNGQLYIIPQAPIMPGTSINTNQAPAVIDWNALP